MIKPKLSVDELIQHMESKGITFKYGSKEAAKEYLKNNNNYFKLSAYRKNFAKHPDGINKGKYKYLDFAYLKDLAIIDMRLRYTFIHICLDIEHFSKVRLMKALEESDENGYDIVNSYIASLDQERQSKLNAELNRNYGNPYCGGLLAKYNGEFPAWSFVEVVSFGSYISFYKYCAEFWENKDMLDEYYLLLFIKDLRNATAHNNCILNDLHENTRERKNKDSVMKELSKINMAKGIRKRQMSNIRIQQIVTAMYVHKLFVKNSGVQTYQSKALHDLTERMFENIMYYTDTPMISSTFEFLRRVVDTWYPKTYNDIT